MSREKPKMYYKKDGTFVVRGNHLTTDDPRTAEMYRMNGNQVEAVEQTDGKIVYYVALEDRDVNILKPFLTPKK